MLLDRIIKIALVEPNLSGHHIVYLKHFIQCLRRKGCDSYNQEIFGRNKLGNCDHKLAFIEKTVIARD